MGGSKNKYNSDSDKCKKHNYSSLVSSDSSSDCESIESEIIRLEKKKKKYLKN